MQRCFRNSEEGLYKHIHLCNYIISQFNNPSKLISIPLINVVRKEKKKRITKEKIVRINIRRKRILQNFKGKTEKHIQPQPKYQARFTSIRKTI